MLLLNARIVDDAFLSPYGPLETTVGRVDFQIRICAVPP